MPKKVLIIGGGLGGLATAWALSRTPALQAAFSVTVVQPGGRLGGKCASGREATTGRILEHGLHMLMGWYDTAFYVLREVYGARASTLPPAYPLALDAFEPIDRVAFGRPGTVDRWSLPFPSRPGVPGDQPAGHPSLRDLLFGAIDGLFARVGLPVPPGLALLALDKVAEEIEKLVDALGRLALPPGEAFQLRTLADLMAAITQGIGRDRLLTQPVETINHWDFRAWLAFHGARRDTVDSALVKGLYDLVFAYPDGDEGNPQVEAGSMLMAALQMGVSYKGAPVWRMRGGMGEIAISPIYEVLKARGVQFSFFHRARELKLDATGAFIDQVVVDRQADLAPGVTAYQPLVDRPAPTGNLRCWLEEPDWTQLQGTPVSRQDLERGGPVVGTVTLQRGLDYDIVVGATPYMSPLYAPLEAASPEWRLMRATMRSVATQSAQLWTTQTLQAMGWTSREVVHSGFIPPFSSWADMSHLLPIEASTSPAPPRGCIYLCGVTPTPVKSAHIHAEWSDWLDAHCGRLWPSAEEPSGFRYSLLEGGSLAGQYLRINDVDSERYVLSVPGSSRTRIAPGLAHFSDFYVAGDWVKSRINGGSAECAFESGLDCADAILAASGIATPPYPAVP